MTEENKQKARDRMHAYHASKKVDKVEVAEKVVEAETDIQMLLARIKELENRNYTPPSNPSVLGTNDKYTLDTMNYQDPTQRLAEEARLQQFAFKLNYELEWVVSSSSYKTLDGINTREPKFHIKLIKIVLDDNGDPGNQRFVLKELIFHEDPDAAVIIAKENNLPVDETNQVSFLNEMRYLRARDWLFDCFFPAKNTKQTDKRQTVIGNRLVEIYEVSSPDAQSIPFGDLQGKV